MPSQRQCPQCGAELPRDAMDGLCPKCMGRVVFGEGEAPGASLEEQPAATIRIEPEPDLAIERAGMRIGRYKLLEQIGEGGFGVVYMAEQLEPVQRKVALKVIKAGMDTKEVIARFEAERQALALMDHPNIARVLDAGATEAGRPYFVMELVKGIPITEFCDLKKLSPTDRLELFMKVCQAVQHAHQKGIIHRDIKPSNVLVTLHDGAPVPKVIDFGIAKALGPKLTEKTLFTGFAHLLGTPAYMSPEQAELSGLDIDTRSDIYSLGVLLYELLTGATPFERDVLAKAALDEIRRMIRETEPPKPSTRLRTLGDKLAQVANCRHTEPAALSRLVRGDLDWIVMKCLEKERTRRYETANGLAMDLQRHLNSEPVVARPPSNLYRFGKMVRRNKLAFAATSAVAAALLIGLGVSTWQFVQKNRAYRRATAAEQQQTRLRQQAEQAARLEAEQRQRAEQLAEQNRQNLYAARINQAWHVFEEGDVTRVLALLDSLKPKTGESDLRGFEWYYLWRLCHSERFNLIGHFGQVRSVAFSPDGLTLASAGNDTVIRLWDTRTGKQRSALDWRAGWITSVAFSPDGKWLAAGNSDNTVGLWETATGKLVHTFAGHTNPVSVVKFAPDGNLLASATAPIATGRGNPSTRFLGEEPCAGELKLWDLNTMKESETLPGHPQGILDLAFSPDGKILASGGADRALRIWDVSTHKQVASRTNFTGPVFSLAFAPGGKVLATAGGYPHQESGEIKFWDVAGFKELPMLHEDVPLAFAIAFTPDGRTLVTAGQNMVVRLWDLASGRTRATFRGHKTFIWSVAVSPDGKTLASADWDGAVKIWDATRTQETEIFAEGGEAGAGYSLAFSPDGKLLATGGSRGLRTTVWEVATAKQRLSSPMDQGDVIVAISDDGGTLAAAGTEGIIQLWNLRTFVHQGSITGHVGKILCMNFSPGSQILAAAGRTNVIELWDFRAGTLKASLKGHTYLITTMSFTPDGLTLASGNGNELRLWNMETAQERATLAERSLRVQFSPSGRLLASGSFETGIKLRSFPELKELVTFRGHKEEIFGIAFSPDSKTLATASWDRTVKLWHVATGQELLSFHAGSGAAWSVAFSPDSRLLAFGSGSLQKGEIALARAANLDDVLEEQAVERAARSQDTIPMPIPKRDLAGQIPPRDPEATRELIDLADYYNASLAHGWIPASAFATTKQRSLGALPLGLQVFSGVRFDIRALVQLAGRALNGTLGASYPTHVAGIRVNQKCNRLHFLHGTGWRMLDGTVIGRYLIHYANGEQQEVAIVYADHVRDWWFNPESVEPTANAVVAWTGKTATLQNLAQGLRLYKFTWENPKPDSLIESIDFVSLNTVCSPFLVAITASSEVTAVDWARRAESGKAAERNKNTQPEVVRTARERLQSLRSRVPANDPQLDQPFVALTQSLIDEGKFADAEEVARLSLALREKIMPDKWFTFNTRSVLGGILVESKKYDEAEPLLLSGYEALKQREDTLPAAGKVCLSNSVERLVQLYAGWGKPDKAAEWKQKLAELDRAVK